MDLSKDGWERAHIKSQRPSVHHSPESFVLPLHYWRSTRPSGPSIVILFFFVTAIDRYPCVAICVFFLLPILFATLPLLMLWNKKMIRRASTRRSKCCHHKAGFLKCLFSLFQLLFGQKLRITLKPSKRAQLGTIYGGVDHTLISIDIAYIYLRP